MARFFKYKSTDDLIQDAHELGGEIQTSEDFSTLFEPLEIRGQTLKNRLAIQPMEG